MSAKQLLFLCAALAIPHAAVAEELSWFEPALRELYRDREMLRSGRIQCEQTTTTFGRTGLPLTLTFQVETVFDGEKVRFTREGQYLVSDNDPGEFESRAHAIDEARTQLAQGTLRRESRRHVLVLTDSTAHLYHDTNKQLNLHVDPDWARTRVLYFDARTLGLRAGAHPEALSARDMKLKSLVNEAVDGRPVVRAGYENAQGFRTFIWYDPELPAVIKIENSTSDITLRSVLTVSYERLGGEVGVWPTKVVWQQFKDDKLVTEDTLKVQEAVCDIPVAPEEFGLDAMKLRDGTILIQNKPQRKPVAVWQGGRVVIPTQPDADPVLIESLIGEIP